MKQLLATIALALSSFACFSQEIPQSQWSLVEVTQPVANHSSTVGYIYHTASAGYEYIGRANFTHHTELRFICSAKGKPNPIIAIFWEGQNSQINLLKGITIKVDRKEVVQNNDYEWVQEGPLTYRKYEESTDLMNALKTGHMVSFEWPAYHTIFSLTGFQQNFDDFLAKCKLQQ